MTKKKVLVIVGPTAVGKTSLGITMAQEFNGEVISGDSLQVYKGLDIGTAKVTDEEKENVPHHLIDIVKPSDTYSAFDFKQSASQLIDELSNDQILPIIVGGTGMYIQSLLFDFDLGSANQESDHGMRDELYQFEKDFGKEALWEKLKELDEKAAMAVHPNNVKRVVRSIEVMLETGKSILEQNSIDLKNLSQSQYDVCLIGLTTDRQLLYDRINQRVDIMMTDGLLDEARYVYDYADKQCAQGIGYKEFFPYFEGQISLEESIEKVKQHSRQYAKRQLTWFNNRMSVDWWDLVQEPKSINSLIEKVSKWYNNEGNEGDTSNEQ